MGLYATQLADVQQAITDLEGGHAAAIINGTTYGVADLSALYAREELLSVQSAIQAIQETGQSYTIGPRSYTRADLRELLGRLDTLRRRSVAATRTGIRVRQGVPM